MNTDYQMKKSKEFLKQYRLHLGGSSRRIEIWQYWLCYAVYLETDRCCSVGMWVLDLSSAHLFHHPPHGTKKHAEVIMQVKNNLCKEYWIIFHVLKWLYMIIVSIMICKTLTNTTFCDNQFNFNNCFIIELKLLAIKK